MWVTLAMPVSTDTYISVGSSKGCAEQTVQEHDATYLKQTKYIRINAMHFNNYM
jgi:hypothetical protein